ncbi:hypothetical protein H2201_007524 [Coniosporium apollinis]|uniref:FCH domain-containing protein n=1 Tax=Coniosporium apollinis TaxID=61459 RepID=A0ABQ9NMY0_9PEZI|nr:hypothetical protein H2201_007524 [Coniosporium apollinis]
MELQRQEYPAMLAALQPGQAVAVLQERVKQVNKLNTDIADWLQERRRIEETYVRDLRKLARRQPPDESSELGIFATPWQNIVSSTDDLANSHHLLAQKIEADVERPLREFANSNRELQAMSTISGNLQAMARDVENAQKKSEKLKGKGEKAGSGKVAHAASDVENAMSQWESQAPFVFEKLQAVDESRLNHLRDVLTQFQTHEVDQVERSRVTAEQCLNALLNVETAEEIKRFSSRSLSGRPKLERPSSSRVGFAPGSSLAPTSPVPAADDRLSQRSGSVQEQKHGGLSGLKRLGTVLGRRRQSVQPFGRESSSPERPERPERKTSSNLFGSLSGRSREFQPPPGPPPPASPTRLSESRQATSQPSELTASPRQTQRSIDRPNGTPLEAPPEAVPSSSVVNGTQPAQIPPLQEPLVPSTPTIAHPEPRKDDEGFSMPAASSDPISQAEQDAISSGGEPSAPQFKVDIRNAPIQEEDADADAALASVANALRTQTALPRKPGTARGRRDVRNTVFIPSPQAPEVGSDDTTQPAASPTPGPTTLPLPQSSPTLAPLSPFRPAQHGNLLSDAPAASDAGSIRSGRSLSSSVSVIIKHPELHEPGLNSSIVETVSAYFEHGRVSRATVIGELALAHNPTDASASSSGNETIRLDNFPVLEKVAPNPTFITQAPDKAGTYTLALPAITGKTAVAFKYQLHLDDTNLGTHAPMQLTTAWKVEPTQTSVIVSYALNPLFALSARPGATNANRPLTLSNVVLVCHLEGARATSCQSKPAGAFSAEKSTLYWRLGDVTFWNANITQQLRARFFTDGEARPGNVEARWEISGEEAVGLGSGLSVSRLVRGEEGAAGPEGAVGSGSAEADPFADETASSAGAWRGVAGVRRIVSGSYVAV